jgi:N6-adenosine-specific RNA methylase IME4
VRPAQGLYPDYPTMTLEQLAALPVRDLAHDDGCHLYLWTTQKFLPDAIKLVDAWGFNYQCLMTWVKPGGMTPYSFMYNTEHVIFARRGNVPLSKLGEKLSFEAPATGHSIKPDIFYQRVALVSPGPRLDMFARSAHEGFTAWGNEAPIESEVEHA